MNKIKQIFIFIGPAFVLYIALILYSVIFNIYLSFHKWSGFGNPKFVLFNNYIKLFKDDLFWRSLAHNFVIMICALTIMLIISLILAIIIDMGFHGSGLSKNVFFLPVVVSIVVIGLVWARILEPSNGPLNLALSSLGLGSLTQKWLGDPNIALGSVIGVWIWRHMGYGMILLLAGLQNIPKSIIEAAKIDGANAWEVITKVTIPMLRPIILTVMLWSVILSFKIFPLIHILTGGGPYHSTEVLNTYMYRVAFQNYNFGYASTIATILLIIMIISSVINRKVNQFNNR